MTFLGGVFLLLFGPVFGGVSGDTRWFATPGSTRMYLEPGRYQVNERVTETADRYPELLIGRDVVEITSDAGDTVEVRDLGRTAAGSTGGLHYRSQLGFTVSQAGDYDIRISSTQPTEAAITPGDLTFSVGTTLLLFLVPLLGLALVIGGSVVAAVQRRRPA